MEGSAAVTANAAIFYVEIIAACTVPIAFIAVVIHRLKSEMGMGYRAIQFLALGTVMPVVLILSLEGKISGEAVAALVGGIVGYLFTSAASGRATKAGQA